MTTPTLPGTIHDLLRLGSVVVDPHVPGSRGVIAPCGPKGDEWHVLWGRPCGVKPRHEDFVFGGCLALDLSDPTGRAHAAWWLALRECPASHVLDPAAVAWHPAPAQADAGWSLEWQARAVKGCGTLTGHWWSGRSRSPVPASLLWHLVRDDPRLLPDGSRWVDAEALRLVCLHVAGVSRV